jgi:hypothetical protein
MASAIARWVQNLFYLFLNLLAGISAMASLIRRFSTRIKFLEETRAPVIKDGANPHGPMFEKDLDELLELVVDSPSAFTGILVSLARLAIPHIYLHFNKPALYDAVMNSQGIDDRKLLVSVHVSQ